MRRAVPLVLLVVLVLGAGIGIGLGLSEARMEKPTQPLMAESRVETHAPALSAALVLASRKIEAGTVTSGEITVQNRTGAPIRVGVCHDLFEVLLGNAAYRPSPGWELCLQYLTVPTGRSSYRVLVRATYEACTQAGGTASADSPPCSATGPPPLPAGRYQAMAFAASAQLPVPKPVAVRVTAP